MQNLPTGVSYKTKIQKFKQITTFEGNGPNDRVFPIKQRYKNLSKSQLVKIIITTH